jgi:predicted MFS family arabinose efflux permease
MVDMIPPQANARDTLPLGLLAAAGFLSSAGSRVIDPLISLIAHDFSVTVPAVSIIIAAFTLPYGLTQLALGPISDRYGKLLVMVCALLGYAVFTTACATAANLGALALLRACAGASSAGLIPVCIAYIGDAVPYEQRQITLSRFASGVVIAQIVAGPLGGAFGEFVGWRGVFLLLGAAGLVVAVMVAMRRRGLTDRRGGHTVAAATYRNLLARNDARQLLVATALEGALTGGVFPFVAPYLRVTFHLPYAVIGLVLACFGLGAFIYTRIAPRVVTRLEEPTLVLGGSLLVATILAALMTSKSWLIFIPAQVAIGFGYLMLHTVMQSRASELLPEARSTAVGLFVFMLFLGQGMGALAVGASVGVWGYRVTLWLAAGGLVSLGVWLWDHMRRFPSLMQPA